MDDVQEPSSGVGLAQIQQQISSGPMNGQRRSLPTDPSPPPHIRTETCSSIIMQSSGSGTL